MPQMDSGSEEIMGTAIGSYIYSGKSYRFYAPLLIGCSYNF